MIILLPISFLLNIFWECILFILCFTPLRRVIGGFHFNKDYLCLIFSIMIAICIPMLSKYFSFISIQTILIIFTIIIFITNYIGSVDNPNKRLTTTEKKYFKRKAIIIEILYLLLSLCFSYIGLSYISSIILVTTIFSCLNCLFAYVIY